jgi:hypothetical protein
MLFRRSMRRIGARSAEANRPSYHAIGQLGHYIIVVIGIVVALQGTVREISMRSTVINTNDNLDVVVPNSLLTNGVLTNWTMTEASRRIHVPFGVAYGTSKEKVKQAGLEAASRLPRRAGSARHRPQGSGGVADGLR